MKKVIIVLALANVLLVHAQQVGIGTSFPAINSSFHVDALKNNTAASPVLAQQADDFVVLKSGNVGIGTTTPTDKLEVNSQITNSSGVKFTNFTTTNAQVNPNGRTIGLDNNGQIIRMDTYSGATFVPNELSSSIQTPFTINGNGYTIIPNTTVSLVGVPNPEIGKILFINYSTTIKFTSFPANNTTNSYYEARVFIDGVPTNAIQTFKEYTYSFGGDGSNPQKVPNPAQFSISTVLPISIANSGSHNIDLRIKRVKNSGETNTDDANAKTISTSNSVAYINF